MILAMILTALAYYKNGERAQELLFFLVHTSRIRALSAVCNFAQTCLAIQCHLHECRMENLTTIAVVPTMSRGTKSLHTKTPLTVLLARTSLDRRQRTCLCSRRTLALYSMNSRGRGTSITQKTASESSS